MFHGKLQEILDHKATEVQRLQPHADALRKMALERNDFRPFRQNLDRLGARLGLIAEVKRASPSAGLISENFDPITIARDYFAAGADALSVLTDEQFFQGHLTYLRDIRDQVPLPLLRKDFIIDPLQIYESVIAGADAILLIVAALPDAQLHQLHQLALTFQLETLVEVHTLEELDRAVDLGPSMIGINNRNLSTFEVSLDTSLTLSEEVPDDILLVSESGIRTPTDTAALANAGVQAILVGETLMRAPDRRAAVQELIHFPVSEHPGSPA